MIQAVTCWSSRWLKREGISQAAEWLRNLFQNEHRSLHLQTWHGIDANIERAWEVMLVTAVIRFFREKNSLAIQWEFLWGKNSLGYYTNIHIGVNLSSDDSVNGTLESGILKLLARRLEKLVLWFNNLNTNNDHADSLSTWPKSETNCKHYPKLKNKSWAAGRNVCAQEEVADVFPLVMCGGRISITHRTWVQSRKNGWLSN